MKKLTFTLITAILLISCSKEKPLAIQQDQKQIVGSAAPNVVGTDNYTNTSYNPCTDEYVFVSYKVHYAITQVIKGDTTFYTYDVSYGGTTGVGLTSGTKYIGTGHVTAHVKYISASIYDYRVIGDGVVNIRVTLNAPGSNNDLITSVIYHFSTTPNQYILIDKDRISYDACH